MRIRFPRAMARANKVVANRVVGLVSPHVPPLATMRHRGRVSGRAYSTPVLAFVRGETMVVALFYGETDWSRNVLAAGGGEIVRLRRVRPFARPRVVAESEADLLPAGTRWAVRLAGAAIVAELGPPAASADDARRT